MISEVVVALIEVPVNCAFRVIHRLIVAVLDYRAGHSTKNRFDHVEELRAGRKWRCFDGWALTPDNKIVFIDALKELLGYTIE
jgi:hypothetical protein